MLIGNHFLIRTAPPHHKTMTFFYESDEDLALRGHGCLSGDNLFGDVENITGMDIADFIEAISVDSSNEEVEEERREDKYEQMAAHHNV